MQEDSSLGAEYSAARRRHWDVVAEAGNKKSLPGRYYHQRLRAVYRNLIPEGLKVLELGCGEGNLLASLKPRYGVGIDFSENMIEQARKKHPELRFLNLDVHDLALNESFDIIILSDLLNDLWDVQMLFERLGKVSTAGTLIFINEYSHVWELPLQLAQHLGLATRKLPQNWFTPKDIASLLKLSGFSVFRSWTEILFPFPLPVISPFCNRFLVKIWPFSQFGLTNFIIARKSSTLSAAAKQPKVSVIIPARNEQGNIFKIIERTPEMGAATELIFVEGHSSDDTYETIEKALAAFPARNILLLQQKGDGKGDAVRLGFERASGDILMILDADMTVPPEILPRFFEVILDCENTLVSGSRLIYPMEKKAMRFMNMLGNKFFSQLFTWLIDQPVKDTLCGTKVLWKKDYAKIAANRKYFGDFDPFGDFDLLFGAAKLNMDILEIPVRYRERTYGQTNIQRWRHGLLLLRMAWFAALKLKFI
jgi:2-polyprenyl-3-methyl-5-hydroxy-6-metoxy-1,4-benzoquinol methylase